MASADVSGSVLSIIGAFANSLDVFGKLRERRRKKKRNKQSAAIAKQRADEELQLSTSLRRGPADIQNEYERNLQVAGDGFARGDAIAHRSLTETLLKLNTGLVEIISSFLSGRKDAQPNYRSLTHLSDASRVEAVDALGQLYQRLSQTRLATQPTGAHQCCQRRSRCSCEKGSSRSRGGDGRRRHHSRPKDVSITRMPLKSASQTQLVVVRPRHARKNTSSSTSSSGSQSPAGWHSNASTPALSPYASPLSTPDSAIAFAPPIPQIGKPRRSRENNRARAAATQRPQLEHRAETMPTPRSTASTIPQQHHGRDQHGRSNSAPAVPQNDIVAPLASGPAPVPRRQAKVTPSGYSFMSASTKLGEIPMRKWASPYDYEAMDRLNAEAEATGWPHVAPDETKPKARSRLLRFFRRGDDGN